MNHAVTPLLTSTEREQARQIWNLLQQDDLHPDGIEGFAEWKGAPENVRLAILEAARFDQVGSEPEQNPFA